jgi:uncharacterized protein
MEHGSTQPVETTSLAAHINSAAAIVAPLWPLETFIAVNQLAGFESLPFQEALKKVTDLYKGNNLLKCDNYAEGTVSDWTELLTGNNACEQLNKHTIKWCSAFLDRGNAVWQMPNREAGLFASFKRLAVFDLRLPRTGRANLPALPDVAAEALDLLLKSLGLHDDKRVDYFTRHLAMLPGWSSHLKWRQLNEQVGPQSGAGQPNLLLEFLAVRTFLDIELNRPVLHKRLKIEPSLPALFAQITAEKGASQASQTAVARRIQKQQQLETDAEQDKAPSLHWHEVNEINYRNQLLNTLNHDKTEAEPALQPEAQLVFCIDVRSEGMRRKLETSGNYQTIGFAGFFGFPINYQSFTATAPRALCPVLIKPQHTVAEVPRPSQRKPMQSWLAAQELQNAFYDVMHLLRSNFLAKFYFAEAAGIWLAPVIMARSFYPSQWQKLMQQLKGNRSKYFSLDLESNSAAGLSLETRATMAAGALKGMGLTDNFAPLVVLCGHGSSSENNAYAYSLDCGACGGNTGGISARVAAAVLNQAEVRAKLAEQGLPIPQSTYFMAAEHNTTTDAVKFFNEAATPDTHRQLLTQLKANLEVAGQRLRAERSSSFLEENFQPPQLRAVDWSQTRPEWGLARNAAFVAGGRYLTRGKNLERRVFLHDYDADKDSELKILELIMTAPLVVAQWINMQYYLSSINNDIFGAGSKTTHNVVGNLGVMQGALSDLKLGLPHESVAASDERLYHQPMRLLAVIEATRSNIDKVIERHKGLLQLVNNNWIRLVALEQGQFFEATAAGAWQEVCISTCEAAHSQRSQVTTVP